MGVLEEVKRLTPPPEQNKSNGYVGFRDQTDHDRCSQNPEQKILLKTKAYTLY